MKRTLVVTLGAATLVLAAAAVAFAQDSTATAPSTTPAAPAKHAMRHAGKASASAKHMKVDINSASADDLKKLPGITDEQAEKIVAARPFKSRQELLSKKLVTRAEYRKIRSWVTAKQEAASK